MWRGEKGRGEDKGRGKGKAAGRPIFFCTGEEVFGFGVWGLGFGRERRACVSKGALRKGKRRREQG